MAQYIDKDALVAKIRKRLLPVVRDKHYDEWEEGQDSERKAILGIIDSLKLKEVKEEPVSEDLEEEIKETLNRKYGCKVTEGSDIWFTRQYQENFEMLSHIANWQKEKDINKACELVVNCIEDFMLRRMEIWDEESKQATLKNIRKAMEAEK